MAGELSVQNAVSMQVIRALEADAAAVAFLARRASQLALRTASAFVATRAQADDIAQDVAIDALRSLAKLRDPGAFDAWVHRIAVRRIGRAIRGQRRSSAYEIPLAMLPLRSEPDVGGNREEQVAMRDALVSALADLPDKQRIALALRYIHDLSDADIAAALGCREGNVRALLSRARSTLKSHEQLAAFTPTAAGGTA